MSTIRPCHTQPNRALQLDAWHASICTGVQAKKRKLGGNDKTVRGCLSGEVDLNVLFDILHTDATAGQDGVSLSGSVGGGGGKKKKGADKSESRNRSSISDSDLCPCSLD